MSEILGDMLAIERTEEALILAAAETGVPIPRREDADVRAVLNLSDNLPAPARD